MPEFSFLLKERVCPLVIRLFSPGVKHYRGDSTANKVSFTISIRLLRIVLVLVKRFYDLLVTESEIFLSMLIKFLDADNPIWQRAVALEVLYELCTQPRLLRRICQYYDMQVHRTKVFLAMVNSLGGVVLALEPQLMAFALASHTPYVASSARATCRGAPMHAADCVRPHDARGQWLRGGGHISIRQCTCERARRAGRFDGCCAADERRNKRHCCRPQLCRGRNRRRQQVRRRRRRMIARASLPCSSPLFPRPMFPTFSSPSITSSATTLARFSVCALHCFLQSRPLVIGMHLYIVLPFALCVLSISSIIIISYSSSSSSSSMMATTAIAPLSPCSRAVSLSLRRVLI